jgi:GTPase
MDLFNNLIETFNPKIKFRPEIEEGNVEYKLRLDQKNDSSLKKMKNQMNWRFEEGKELTGKRECYYLLGIRDDGSIGGLTEKEIDVTYDIFKEIIIDCDASVLFYEKKNFNDEWYICICLGKPPPKKLMEINVGFVGPSQTGKTSTISNIVYGQLDNGEGVSRNHVFKHEHERISGLTSSIKKEIIGIKNNRIINYNTGINTSWDQIANMSEKILSLIDLPGSHQYIKTTLFGLSSYNFDALVIFNDNNCFDNNHINKLYIEYACILKIPYIIVEINDIITPTSLMSYKFNDNSAPNFIYHSNYNLDNYNIQQITNLKPNGITCIISFLMNLTKRNNYLNYISENIFTIYDIIPTPDTGIIYSGEVWYGKLSVNDDVYLTNGNLIFKLKIKSIHKQHIYTENIYAGDMGGILLSGSNMEILKYSKHMIITSDQIQSYNQIIFTNNSPQNITLKDTILVYINNNILKGFIKEINNNDINNIKYTMVLFKNNIIVPRVNNTGFAKINNNIFLINLILN